MGSEIPPGKAAVTQWMKGVSGSLRYRERLQSSLDLIWAGEYIVGIENFLSNLQPVGWSNAKIESDAHQLQAACELANSDPHPEYLSEARIDEFVEAFKKAAGYKAKS